ncbi:MAG: cellulase family glycosylhydrolase [bacterium]
MPIEEARSAISWRDREGTQSRYVDTWREVARTFADEDGVLGYDVMNEPWTTAAWFVPQESATTEPPSTAASSRDPRGRSRAHGVLGVGVAGGGRHRLRPRRARLRRPRAQLPRLRPASSCGSIWTAIARRPPRRRSTRAALPAIVRRAAGS